MSTNMFQDTITVYNAISDTDPATSKDVFTNYITVLHGVLVDECKASNVMKSGLVGADAVNIYIPIDVKAVDGITGNPKKYVSPVEFWKAEDPSDLWTLSVGKNKSGPKTGGCFFIKGVAVHPEMDVGTLEAIYGGNVFDISTIDTKDFGGLPHWEVGAN